MEHSHELPHESEHDAPDYHQRLADVLKVRNDNLALAPEHINAITTALSVVYTRYGNPAQDSYHPYHNDIHSFNVTTGSWRVLDFMRDELHFDVNPTDYAVGGLIGSLHDIIHEGITIGTIAQEHYPVDFGSCTISVENDGTKTDEMLSAECAVLYLNKRGLSPDVQQRVGKGIRLTEVTFEDGAVIQKGAGQGGRDYGAIAAAIADTEGIFGGEERLAGDVARLVAEMLGEKAGDEGIVSAHITKFMESEKAFVNQKITEFILHIYGTQEDPEKLREIQDKFHSHFEPYRQKALGAAALFDSTISDFQQRRDKIKAKIDSIRTMIGSGKATGDD